MPWLTPSASQRCPYRVPSITVSSDPHSTHRRDADSQSRIGYGPRGRGLYYQPHSESTTSGSREASYTGSGGSFLAADPRPLIDVPLWVGLALVTSGGSVQLQHQLLEEWQSHNGLTLPGPLAALLQATDRPPALRLVAWLLWVLEQPAGMPAPQTTTILTPADAPAPSPSASSAAPPPPPPPPSGPHCHLAEYVRQVLPPASSAASCLRLAEVDAILLPADVRVELDGMRQQVSSYCKELRSLGLDGGCDDATIWWAFDMVTSRTFAVSAPLPATQPATTTTTTTTTTVPLALFCPWADLLNHSPSPNAAYDVDLPARRFLVRQLHSWRLLEPGVELCISYGSELDNVQQLLRYGFCTPGNPNDRLALSGRTVEAASRLLPQVLNSAAEALADRPPAPPEEEQSGTESSSSSSSNSRAAEARDQHRSRVFTALMMLKNPVVADSGQIHLGSAGLESSSTGGASTPEGGPLAGPLAADPPGPDLPAGALLPTSDTGLRNSIMMLHSERDLLAKAVNDILRNYASPQLAT